MTFWTDERIEQLRVYVEAGELSFGMIGKRLCCTRNAAIGKSKRLGFRQMNSAWKKRRLYKERPRLVRVMPKPVPIVLPTEPLPLTPLGTSDHPAPDLCRFPYGEAGKPDFAFCARPVGNRPYRDDALPSYCAAHAELCYQGKGQSNSGWAEWKRRRQA